MFGHKTIYKVTNLKVHSKERYFIKKKIPFQGLQRTARTQKGRTLGWALLVSKSKPSAGVFISLYSWWKPTVFRKLWMSFSFNLEYNVNLVIPNSATSLCCVDRVWKGIIHKRLLSRGGGGGACLKFKIIGVPITQSHNVWLWCMLCAGSATSNWADVEINELVEVNNQTCVCKLRNGESYCNNVNCVKNYEIFEPPSMRACSSTPPKQN